MKSYHRQGECELCQTQEAEIFADGQWICFNCEAEMAEDCIPDMSALEKASILWACDSRIVK